MLAKNLPKRSNVFCIVIMPIANHENSFTKCSLCVNMTPGKNVYCIAYVNATVDADW